jgi:hypothetical protein
MNGSQFKTAGTDSMAVLASFHLHGFDLKIQAARLVLSYLKKKNFTRNEIANLSSRLWPSPHPQKIDRHFSIDFACTCTYIFLTFPVLLFSKIVSKLPFLCLLALRLDENDGEPVGWFGVSSLLYIPITRFSPCSNFLHCG